MKPRERFLATCRRETVDRPPVWLMRQAGRYLPEYRELRARHEFLEILTRPDLIIEASLQPWLRFGMDAVIVFSDILVPARSMGLGLSYNDERGPHFDRRVESASDIDGLKRTDVTQSLAFVLESLVMLRRKLSDEAALIGFVGGPWTLACYLVQGGSGDFTGAMEMANTRRDFIGRLLDRLTDVLVEFAVEQVRSGADVIQIFDTWGGLLEPAMYDKFVLPGLKCICRAIEDAGGVPILFVRDSDKLLPIMRDSEAKVLSLGPSTDLKEAWRILGDKVATQGNLEPKLLLGSPTSVREITKGFLKIIGDRVGHIVNLGHGVLPVTSPECVKAFVEAVKVCVQP